MLPYATALGLALVHSLWIGALLYVVVRTLLPLLPGPRARHHLAYAALLGLAGSFAYVLIYVFEPEAPVCENLLAAGFSLDVLAAAPVGDSFTERFLATLPAVAPWLSAGYLLGLFPAALFLLRDQWRIRTLTTVGLHDIPAPWAKRLGNELLRHPATRRVRCFLSDRAGEAMTLGFWRPVIVLPVALVNQLTPEMAHTILLHEIAHLRHYDHWLNYPQQIIRTFFFFHPAAHALCRLIDREREHRCDDWVAERCSDRRTYATALVTVARTRHEPQLVLGMSATRTAFSARVQRLFGAEEQRSGGRYAFSALLVTLLSLGHFGYTYLGADAGAVDCLEEQSRAHRQAVDQLWQQLTATPETRHVSCSIVPFALPHTRSPREAKELTQLSTEQLMGDPPGLSPLAFFNLPGTRAPSPEYTIKNQSSYRPCTKSDVETKFAPPIVVTTDSLPPGMRPISNDDPTSQHIDMSGMVDYAPASTPMTTLPKGLLVLVNGERADSALQTLDPSTIETLRILKGDEIPEALRIFEPEGIIMITTKR